MELSGMETVFICTVQYGSHQTRKDTEHLKLNFNLATCGQRPPYWTTQDSKQSLPRAKHQDVFGLHCTLLPEGTLHFSPYL